MPIIDVEIVVADNEQVPSDDALHGEIKLLLGKAGIPQREKQILMPRNKKEEKLKSTKIFLIAFGLLFLIFFAFSQIRKSGVIRGNVTEASPVPSEIAEDRKSVV